MRPVNLIPAEERRGAEAQLRGGPLVYVVLGGLVALLLGVVLLVNASNQVNERKSEVTQLESEAASVQAKSDRLAAYVSLAEINDRRIATVKDLAESRFDWERVIRELSLIVPGNVELTNLTGTAKPDVSVNGAASIAMRTTIPGPALELLGCTDGQDGVAAFVADLKEIDGVTRVGVQSSKESREEGGSSEDEAAVSAGGCQDKSLDFQFEIIAAFDAAPEPTLGAEG
jgi:Tfp pilus assembly protein PilN